jgi:hypothetical protein
VITRENNYVKQVREKHKNKLQLSNSIQLHFVSGISSVPYVLVILTRPIHYQGRSEKVAAV